jgi:hypothetical protein
MLELNKSNKTSQSKIQCCNNNKVEGNGKKWQSVGLLKYNN